MKSKISVITHYLLYILAPFLMFLLCELCYNRHITDMRWLTFFVSLGVFLLLEIILVGLIPKHRIGLCIGFLLSFGAGFINHYVIEFRGIPVMLMDLYATGTALNVASSYQIVLDNGVAISLLLMLLLILIALMLPKPESDILSKKFPLKWRYVYSLIVSGVGAAIFVIWLSSVRFSGYYNIVLNLWDPVLTYEANGFAPSFIAYAQFSNRRAPEDYDKKEVERILMAAKEEFDDRYGYVESDIKPNIISIMDEAFCDLSILGPLECNDTHLSNFRKLKSNTGIIEYGNAYISTFGGGTARTEYEWLTGYSISFFPNVQPYSQFRFGDIMTCLDSVIPQGYDTVAMHPEKPSNYRRNTVYESMGFDKFLSIEDFKDNEHFFFREERVTDSGDFERIITEDESTENPLFVHNVTMQNHGSFDSDFANKKLLDVDVEYMKYTDFRKYQTLLSMSDEAINELITYYENSSEPTIICLYGDHQPSLNEMFIRTLMIKGKNPSESELEIQQKRYIVPYFIWSNYDISEGKNGVSPFSIEGTDIVSTNYLGVLTRAYAGQKLSAFDKYLLLLREKIPMINSNGYIGDDERMYSYDEESKYSQLINEYEMIQYSGMFDNEGLEYLFSVD